MEDLPAPLRVVIVGNVDHGKSTLIGRLLNEAGALPRDRVEALMEISRTRGVELEWAFVTDALQAERDGGATIDISQAAFHTDRKSFVIIDAPGQDEFLRNMVTGAATADVAIIVVDAAQGVSPQSRRHLYLLSLLGVRRLIVAINKMDKVGYSADRFAANAKEVREYLQRIDVAATAIIPISAKRGEMIATRTPTLAWYHGPTLLEALDRLEPDNAAPELMPLRFSVQDVYKFDERRILAGRVESGVLRVGDLLSFGPSGVTARVASIEDWNQPTRRLVAAAGDTMGITLDARVYVARGYIAAPAAEPIGLAKLLKLRIFWLDAEPLRAGRSLTLKLAAGDHPVTVREIVTVIDLETLERRKAPEVETNEVAEIVLEANHPVAVDRYASLPRTGRGVLIDEFEAIGCATILDFVEVAPSLPPLSGPNGVTREERERRNRHRGAVLWLTGLPGSGKSTLAAALERALFEGGMHAVLIDGDRVRQGLSHDLGFDHSDRSENTRRVAEAARLLADSGNIAIVALVSPYSADRERARAIVGEGFAEIFIRADLALCQARDPKGLYARARAGERNASTGIETVYEPPDSPDLEIDTGQLNIAQSIDRLIGFVDARFHDPRIDQRLIEPEWSV
jgi:bifunctional enzyme CysN/CysC